MNSGPVRTLVYVDGFNLYHGALKRASPGYRWLDLKAMVGSIIHSNHRIDGVYYFTAWIRTGGQNDNSLSHQKIYVKALENYITNFNYRLGHFISKKTRAKPVDGSLGHSVQIWDMEEKGSDVNLASRMISDAFQDNFDCAIIVANDGDYAEAIRVVKQEAGKTVGVILPLSHPDRTQYRKASQALYKEASFVRSLRTPTIYKSQLPDPIPGTHIYKPAHW